MHSSTATPVITADASNMIHVIRLFSDTFGFASYLQATKCFTGNSKLLQFQSRRPYATAIDSLCNDLTWPIKRFLIICYSWTILLIDRIHVADWNQSQIVIVNRYFLIGSRFIVCTVNIQFVILTTYVRYLIWTDSLLALHRFQRNEINPGFKIT